MLHVGRVRLCANRVKLATLLRNLLSIVGLSLCGPAAATFYYVSPAGQDSNPGTLALPFATIQKGVSSAGPGDTVVVRQGVYRETVKFSTSGTSSAPITLEGFSGETAVIDGCDLITGWTSSNGQLQVSPGWDLGVGVNELFVDGAMLPEARWPKFGTISRPAFSTVGTAVCTSLGSGSQVVMTDSNLLFSPTLLVGAKINTVTCGTLAQTGTVQLSALGSTTFTTSVKLVAPVLAGNGYFLYGNSALVTSPGDWELLNGQLSFIPNFTDAATNHAIELKHRTIGIDLRGISYVNVQGINLFACTLTTNSASSGISLQGIIATYPGHNLVLNQPYGDGDAGIVLAGTNNSITSSVIGPSSGAGITISGSGTNVINCQIHDTDYAASNCGAIVLTGSNFNITNNTIYNAGRMGISHYSTSASNFCNNEIFYFALQTSDVGGTYTYENDLGGTVISYNLIHDAHGTGPGADGIFIDNNCLNTSIHHNIVYNVDHGVHLNSFCTNIMVANNTLDTTTTSLFLDTGTDFTNVTLANNISLKPNYFYAGVSVNQETNLIFPTNPMFVNELAANFQLQPGSPAIGAGTAVTGITSSASPDLGALAYQATPWTAGASIGNAPPPAPNAFIAAAGLGQVSLAWNPRPEATSYNVYRSSSATGPFSLVASKLTQTTYADTTAPVGSTSYYYITAVNSFGESGDSGSSSAFCYAAIQLQGLLGEYYNANGPNNMWGGLSFGSPVARQIDPNVNFSYGILGTQIPGMGENNFAVRWTGYVTAPVTGAYTFTASYDAGARLSVNGQTMFDQFDGPIGTSSGTINLVAGQTYPIRMEYCVSGLYGYAYLYWAYPGQTQQIIPSSALTPTAGTGMEGSYFNDNPGNFGSFGTFVSSEVDSNFYRWWNSPPQPGMNETWWSAQWRGQLLAPVTATYNFAVMADNGESLTINGQPLTNRWLNTVGTEYGSIQLTAGQLYNVQLNYANGTGPGGLYFEWAFPGQNLQPVPSKYLFTPMQSNLHGIEGVYYSDPNFATTALTRTDSGINFNWASTPPASSMPSSNYSVLWSGQLLAQQSASTYFLVKAVGKVILTVDGQVLLNNNSSTPWSIQTRGLILAAGQRYDIKVQYQPGTSPGSIQLLWRCQGQSTATIIPSSALFLNYDLTP